MFASIEYSPFLLALLVVVMVNAMFFFSFREAHTAVAFWAVMGASATFGATASFLPVKMVLIAVLAMVVLHVAIKMAGMAYLCASNNPDRKWDEKFNLLWHAIDCDPYKTEYLEKMAFHCHEKNPPYAMQCLMKNLSTRDGSMRIDCTWESLASIFYHMNEPRLFVNWAMQKSRQYKPERKA